VRFARNSGVTGQISRRRSSNAWRRCHGHVGICCAYLPPLRLARDRGHAVTCNRLVRLAARLGGQNSCLNRTWVRSDIEEESRELYRGLWCLVHAPHFWSRRRTFAQVDKGPRVDQRPAEPWPPPALGRNRIAGLPLQNALILVSGTRNALRTRSGLISYSQKFGRSVPCWQHAVSSRQTGRASK
jgi:hypothetical protein